MTDDRVRELAYQPADPQSPLMLAWERYKASEEYTNTRTWALHVKHVDGSLWAAFEHGYRTAIRETAEECAKVCAQAAKDYEDGFADTVARSCAAAIRERFK
jgi:hypothetical protein